MSQHQNHSHGKSDQGHASNGGHHFILPVKTALIVAAALLVLTAITVISSRMDFGWFNFPLAMIIATTKALLVISIFMGLYYDKIENSVIFGTSFIFLAIFFALTAPDILFRTDQYVTKAQLLASMPQAKSQFKKAWVPTPELEAHGKVLYSQQCAACHGAEGKGDGPAAASANPKPRNFHVADGWKNGRKPSQVFLTLKNGIPGSIMASFASLPADDRWALAHYVLSLGPSHDSDSPEDLTAVGVDPNSDGAAEEAVKPSTTIKFALERSAGAEPALSNRGQPGNAGFKGYVPNGEEGGVQKPNSVGAQIYTENCASCHGLNAEGGIKVNVMGGAVKAFNGTRALTAASIGSLDSFKKLVVNGIPGDVMPAHAELSGSEISELYQFLRLKQ